MKDKRGVTWPNVKRYCPKCKDYTFHTDHGFRGHNYREVCSNCDTINYMENQ